MAWLGSLFLLSYTLQVMSIGPCNNTLIQQLMSANAKNCPKYLLEQIAAWPQHSYRVMPKILAANFTCSTGVLGKPQDNVAVFQNFYTTTNTSRGIININFTLVEAQCGLVYKHIAEQSYTSFKVVFSYLDGISFGYHACTSEFPADDTVYSVCFAPAVDSPKVDESLAKCKQHMENVTGSGELALLPVCVNNVEAAEQLAWKTLWEDENDRY